MSAFPRSPRCLNNYALCERKGTPSTWPCGRGLHFATKFDHRLKNSNSVAGNYLFDFSFTLSYRIRVSEHLILDLLFCILLIADIKFGSLLRFVSLLCFINMIWQFKVLSIVTSRLIA